MLPLTRPPLPRSELERLAPFWLESFSDVELRDMAYALGVEHASVENVRRWRERLSRPSIMQAATLSPTTTVEGSPSPS